MPLSLVGGNVEASAGDTGTYTWADVLAVGAPGITVTNGVTTINNVRVRMRGTATLNITNQVIVCIVASVSQTFYADEQSTIRFGTKATVSGRETYRDGCEITFRSSRDTTTDFDRTYIALNAGALNTRIFCYATTIRAVRLSNNNRADFMFTELIQSTIIAEPSGWDEGIFIGLFGAVICLKNNFFRTRAIEFSGSNVSSFTASGNTFYDCPATFQLFNTGATVYTIADHDAVGFGAIAGAIRGSFRFLDPIATFTLAADMMVADFGWVGGSSAPQTSYKSYSHTLKLSSGGSAVNNALVTYTNATLGSTSQTSNSNGLLPTSFVLDVENTNSQFVFDNNAYFTNTAGFPDVTTVSTAAWTREIKSYLHNRSFLSLTINSKIGSATLPFDIDLSVDEGVTETNTTTVGAYSGITNSVGSITLSGTLTLNQVYDSRKLYWRNNSGVSVPTKNGAEANFGSANITINAPSNLPATTAKFTELSATGTITLGAVGNYSATPFIASGSSVITVASGGVTDLRTWNLSGTTINTATTATVIVASTTGITAGTGVTLELPVIEFAAPNINSGGFDNVRCRTSLYLRVAFTNANVNATTNQITLAGSSGKITQNTVVRLAGTDLPAPLEPDQVFYPRTIAGNSFTLSNQPGGAGSDIDLTDTGSGPMVAILTTELNNALVTSGGYTFPLSTAAAVANVTLASGDALLFQAIHWKGSLQTVSPAVASRYHEEFQSYQGGSVLTLSTLKTYSEHDLFSIRQSTDGYEISQLTVSGSSPTRYQWRVDASAPGRVQIESEDPDRVISSELAVLYFQYMQWTLSGLRLFRGQIEAENLNSIVIKSPEVGIDADLTVESFPVGIPLLVNGPGMYRSDGKTWIAVGSPIQHQPDGLIAVPIEIEKPINLSPEVMQLLHSIAAGTAIATQASNGLDAAGVRSAIGLASANLDTQLSNIPSNVWASDTRSLTDKAGFSLTQAFPSNFASLAITVGGAVTVGTNNDKTGYSLSGTQSFNLTGNITGNLSGSVGSVTSAVTLPSIPANWITAAGINNGAITAAKFATDAIDGNAIAASAVTEIQSGLATSSAVAAIPTNPLLASSYVAPDNSAIAAIGTRTARVDALITNPGGGDRFTTLALSNAPTGGGSDSPGVTTLLNRLTSTRAGYLDNLSGGAVMLASSYTAPANSDIAAIKAKTDQLGFTSGNVNAIALAGSISVSSVANDAITAAALSADAIAEIQSGLATSSQVTANGFTNTDRTALLSAQSAALAVADGRQKINYPASTFTIYNADGSVRRVFNLRDQDNNAASSAATAVERIPQ